MNEDGVWRTICGRRVFIKNGQSLSDAIKESGRFNKTQIDIASKIDELLKKKSKLQIERAENEIKEDLATPIVKKEEPSKVFNKSDYQKIDDDEFYSLSASQIITEEQSKIMYDKYYGYIATDCGMSINECLRNPKLEMNFEQRKTYDAMKNVIQKNKAQYNIAATRYVNEDYLESEFGIKFSRERTLNEFKEAEKTINSKLGKVITNKGFMSVSLTDNSIFKDSVVKLNTYIKEGTNMFVTKNIEESEAILNSNMKYKILSAYNVADDYGYNQLNIDIEVLK